MLDRAFRSKFSSLLVTGIILMAGLLPLSASATEHEVEAWGSPCGEGATAEDTCRPEGAEAAGNCTQTGDTLICREPTEDEGEGDENVPTEAPSTHNLINPLGSGVGLPEIFARIISIMTAVSGSIALLMFVYGGVLWLTSNGDSGRVETGRKTITWAVIGLIVIFGSYALLRIIFVALGGGGIL